MKPRSVCPYPFSRTSLNAKSFIPCCDDWLKSKDLLYKSESEDKWNGESAANFRQRMYQGDFSSCKRELCQEPLIEIDSLDEKRPLITEGHLLTQAVVKDIKAQNSVLSSGPSFVSFGSSDNVCNLKCPSCRPEQITKLTTRRREAFYSSLIELKKYRADIEIIRLGDNGEVFFSPRIRKLLKVLTKANFPKLKEVKILSNGTLLNEKMWRSCSPGTELISEINISVDAGRERDYEIVRGPMWKTLLKNLEFISKLKRDGAIKRFYLNMTVQYHNYQGLSELITLGSELGVDSILLHPIHHWSGLSANEYLAKAVHRKEHPEHQKFLNVLKEAKNQARDLSLDLNCKLPV